MFCIFESTDTYALKFHQKTGENPLKKAEKSYFPMDPNSIPPPWPANCKSIHPQKKMSNLNFSSLGVHFDPPLAPLKLVSPLYKARKKNSSKYALLVL